MKGVQDNRRPIKKVSKVGVRKEGDGAGCRETGKHEKSPNDVW